MAQDLLSPTHTEAQSNEVTQLFLGTHALLFCYSLALDVKLTKNEIIIKKRVGKYLVSFETLTKVCAVKIAITVEQTPRY